MQAHDVLDVRRGASRQEVAAAFRRYALRHHPDRGGEPARFQAGTDAYHRLTGRPAPATPRFTSTSPTGAPRADVVFHRRPRPGFPALLRLARRRLPTVPGRRQAASRQR